MILVGINTSCNQEQMMLEVGQTTDNYHIQVASIWLMILGKDIQ